MKKVLFLGYVVTPEEANSASGASVAGNKMQWNIVRNLGSADEVNVYCLTITPIACFPRDSMIFQKASDGKLAEGVVSKRISYINLPIIKQITQIISMYRTANRTILNEQIKEVVCFNLFPQIGIPLMLLKKKFPLITSACILADLPIDDNTKRKGISIWLRRLFEKITWNSFRACDKFVVLNKKVGELYARDKPYIVIDGGVSEEDIITAQTIPYSEKEKIILFCGALTEYNGIGNLIRAFEKANIKEAVLDIYGNGYLENEVKLAAQKNPKIHYYGRVDNRTVLQKQREAWILVNPRVVDDPIAKVTFPSKTFEYLLSGTVVVSTHLNGYSEEYNDLMIFSGDSVDELAQTIVKAMELSEDNLNDYASKAKEFVLSKRKWKYQGRKIMQFIWGELLCPDYQ